MLDPWKYETPERGAFSKNNTDVYFDAATAFKVLSSNKNNGASDALYKKLGHSLTFSSLYFVLHLVK